MGTSLKNSFLFGELNSRTLELVDANNRLQVCDSLSSRCEWVIGWLTLLFSLWKNELAERIKVQAELEAAMKLAQAAVISKNQFLANMSHEVYKIFGILCVF